MRQGCQTRVCSRPWWMTAAVMAACALVMPVSHGQGPAESTLALQPEAAVAPANGPGGPMPVWQAPPLPQAVIQAGAIPPGWQPQAVPYQGVGPDGRPLTMYFAPTYVFTYQAGPPVLALPTVNRSQAFKVAPSAAGQPPVTVARYQPTPYQFPVDSRALTGTPITPPAGSPLPPPTAAPPPPAVAAAPAADLAPPPSQWGPSAAPPPAAPAAASSGDWVTVVPPAVASAALAAGATTAGATAADPQMAAVPPPMESVPQATSTPTQPVSSGGLVPAQPANAPANSHLWRVVGVSDGDTLTCLDENNQQQKVRLSEIDAPELGQDYGKNSRETLAALVFGRTVEVRDEGRDRYGRWVGHVLVDGVDVNRQMVATGNAWHYEKYSTDQSLAALQSQAQSQRIGLWSQPNPVAPWQYRASGGQ